MPRAALGCDTPGLAGEPVCERGAAKGRRAAGAGGRETGRGRRRLRAQGNRGHRGPQGAGGCGLRGPQGTGGCGRRGIGGAAVREDRPFRAKSSSYESQVPKL